MVLIDWKNVVQPDFATTAIIEETLENVTNATHAEKIHVLCIGCKLFIHKFET